MAQPFDLHHSIGQIRRRLFLLLMQAFGAVVLLTIVLLVGLIGVVLSRAAQGDFNFEPPLSRSLQAYYLGHGSWSGVEALLRENPEEIRGVYGNDWIGTLLLDEAQRVLIDEGRTDTALIGQTYAFTSGDLRFVLRVSGEAVGTLVVRGTALNSLAVFAQLVRGLAAPVIVISFFTGALTLLIGFMLARRVVTPLADVIAATQAVAAGDLSTRVQVRGPGELRGLSEGFNQMAAALERSDRERRNMLADVAHELRTPLSVIRGRLEGMVDDVYPVNADEIGPVLEETYLLERLVDDLRLLTRAEARQLHFDLRPIALGELAQQAVEVFEAEAADRQIRLDVELEPDLPMVTADAQRVSQVIGNLLSNALRYVPEGGRVLIRVQRASPGAAVVVSDNGPGVAPADLPHVFDRFWRGEKSRARAAGGAGLGLAIAKQLIEAQGGRIGASPAREGGLQIAFTLS
jgi:two-component system OmpR family sensor kinase/two-component system sensor histidine kinase BaeS